MWLRLGEFSSRNTERYPTPLGLRAKCSLRVVALLCCILLHLEHAHAIKFSGKYKAKGIKSSPAIPEIRAHCNNLLLSETYQIVKKNEIDLEFRPGYNSLGYEPVALTSAAFSGHLTSSDTFSGSFHGRSNCSGEFLPSKTLLHCPAPKEEELSGLCIITLECIEGPCLCLGEDFGGKRTGPRGKIPFDVVVVNFLVWLWKRLFLALVVTFVAFIALALTFVTVHYTLKHQKYMRGHRSGGGDHMFEWLIPPQSSRGGSPRDGNQCRRVLSADSLPMADEGQVAYRINPTEQRTEHRRMRSLASQSDFYSVSCGNLAEEANLMRHDSSENFLSQRKVTHSSSMAELKNLKKHPSMPTFL